MLKGIWIGTTHFNLKQIMINILDQKELEELCLFSGTYREEDSQEVKDKFHEVYRKVEAETNQQIEEAGSITKWYESGKGRLMDLTTI